MGKKRKNKKERYNSNNTIEFKARNAIEKDPYRHLTHIQNFDPNVDILVISKPMHGNKFPPELIEKIEEVKKRGRLIEIPDLYSPAVIGRYTHRH